MSKNEVRLKSGLDLTIRPSTESDAAELLDYLNVIGGESDFVTFGKNEFKTTIEEEIGIIRTYQKTENQLHCVGIINGNIISVLNIASTQKPRLRHVGEIGVSVKKEHWNQGVAKAMFEYMFDWAHNNKILKKLMLRVRSDNESAISVYRKFGFNEEGRLLRDFYLHGTYYDGLIMGKWLDDEH